MRILTAKQIKAVEESAFQNEFTEEGLMKCAGTACFNKIVKKYGDALKSSSVAVLCGNGKNAGDGFVIARLLCDIGVDAVIVIADKMPELREPLMYYNEALENGVKSVAFDDYNFDCGFIVDCLFGIGFHGEARAPFDAVFNAVNAAGAVVISIDTPSGTDARLSMR